MRRALAGAAGLAAALLFGGLAAPPASAQTEVPADWSLIPSGLETGDTFRLLIVTSTTRNARSSAIADYDTHVQNAAASGHTDIKSYESQFKVLGSTETVNARDHTETRATDTSAPIYYLNGEKVADDYADLYDGEWDSQVPRDESGDEIGMTLPDYIEESPPRVWTGTFSDGTTAITGTQAQYLGATGCVYAVPRYLSYEIDGSVISCRVSFSLYGLSPVFRVAGEDMTASGEPTITGIGQVGQMLTAEMGDIADTDGLPDDFPDDYTFQWVRTAGATSTPIPGATESTYTLLDADDGTVIMVEVTYVDDADNTHTRTSLGLEVMIPAAEDCAMDRPYNDWCATMTVGVGSEQGDPIFGYNSQSGGVGELDDTTIDFPPSGLLVVQWAFIRDRPVAQDLVQIGVNARRNPVRGSVFNMGGAEFTFGTDNFGSSQEIWARPSDLTFVEGQKVTVSVNLMPRLVSATVDGTSLVLTYTEDLDTGSMPAANAYTVKVDGGSGAAPSSVSIAGTEVTLTLATAVTAGQTVTVSYTLPSSNPLQDESGVDAHGLPDQAVTNNSTSASTDATLSHLTVNDGSNDLTLTPAFDPTTREYAVTVPNTVMQVTVTPTRNDTNATVAYEDGAGNELTDADLSAAGHQVTVNEGANVIVVTVTAEDGTPQPYTVTVTREAPPNTAPTAEDSSVPTDEDVPYTFKAEDFKFTDAEGDALAGVTIVTLPAAGALELDGTAVTAGLAIAAADIGTLVFTPAADGNGMGYASFTFKVSDGTAESAAAAAMTVNVTPVNDLATGAPAITGTATVGETLTAAIGTIADTDGLPTFPSGYTVQWYRVDADGTSNKTAITGANSDTYTLTDAEQGKRVIVEVEFTDEDNNAEGPLASDPYPSTGTVTSSDTTATGATVASSWSLIPSGLGAGDTFRLLIVTSTTRDATSSAIADYDTHVQNAVASGHTDIRSYSSMFKALGSTETVNARDHTLTRAVDTSVPIYYLNGAKVADDYADLYDGDWDSHVPRDESGFEIGMIDPYYIEDSTPSVWTGTLSDGATADDTPRPQYLGSTVATLARPRNGGFELDSTRSGNRTPRSLYGLSPVFRVAGEDMTASGEPTITGIGQVGRMLTAEMGDIADTDGLPDDFPDDYTFQWVRTAGATSTPIPGATESTYTLLDADGGNVVKVEVTYGDDAGTTHTRTSLGVEVIPAAEDCAIDRPDSDWCATMTVGVEIVLGDTFSGYWASRTTGELDDTTIDYPPSGPLEVEMAVIQDVPVEDLTVGVQDRVLFRLEPDAPRRSVVDMGGAELTFGTDNVDDDPEVWARPSDLAFIEGQKVTVSVNLVPGLVSATVDGTALVLTYVEDLDTTSTPDTDEYEVKVDGGPGTAPSGVSVAGKEVELTLATAVSADQKVTVSYTVPASGPVQDESGIDAPGFVDQEVDNNTEASTDATLSALVVNDGTSDLMLTPGFASDEYSYTATVGSAVMTVTVTATRNDSGATVAYEDGAGSELTDADLSAAGHQVTVNEGANTITVKVTAEDDTTTLTYTVTVMREAATNTAPTAEDSSVPTDEDVPYTFKAEDFKFTDAEGDALAGVTIVTLPAAGALELDGTAVTAGLAIAAADIGTLVFTPAADGNGMGYASFTFKVSDGTAESAAAAAMTVNVTPVNDLATGAPAITGTATVGETLTAAIGTIADTDGLPTFPSGYELQWYRVDADGTSNKTAITGANSDTYTLTDAEQGKRVIVEVEFTDEDNNAEGPLASDPYPSTGTVTSSDTTATGATVASSWSLIPSGLGAGDTFRLLIVTSTTRDATSSAIADYDTHVQNAVAAGHADIQAYGSQFKVLGSTETVNARDHTETRATDTNAPIYYLNGEKVADDYADLYDGDWDSNVPRDESGSEIGTTDPYYIQDSTPRVWTGTLSDGATAFNHNANPPTHHYLGYLNPVPSRGSRPEFGQPRYPGNEIAREFRFEDRSGSLSLYGLSPVFRVAGGDTTASGEPTITGIRQVGRMLTAEMGDIADTDGLPDDFPDDYTFQWVRTAGATSTPIPGATESTYTLLDADGGNVVKVEVTYGDDAGTTHTRTSLGVEVIPAAEDCAIDRPDSDWCATMTVGVEIVLGDTFSGYWASRTTGELDDTTIDYPPSGPLEVEMAVIQDVPVEDLTVGVQDRVLFRLEPDAPRRSVVDMGGAELTFGTDNVDDDPEVWARPSGLAFIEGQKVTVSVNLVPGLVSATVDGTSLVLTYTEDLDTTSTPDTDEYEVKVDGGSGAAPSSVTISGKEVELTLATAVSADQKVTVSYTVPASGPVQDESGIDAPGFIDQEVDNNTEASGDATLSALVVSDGTSDLMLTPAFDPATREYAVMVPNAVAQVTVTPTENDANAMVAYTPAADADPDTDGHQVTVNEGANVIVVTVTAEDGTPQPYTVTVTREAPPNTAPTAEDSSVPTDEDVPYTFKAEDFKFTDAEGDALAGVTIVTLPAAGALELDGTAVTAGLAIAAADIGKLVFTPAADGNGMSYASFTFKVSDGTAESAAAAAMTVNVTPANDLATGAPVVTGTAQVGRTLTAAIGTIADLDVLPVTFPDDYEFQWVHVDASDNETPISGAASNTYVLVDADIGKTLKVRVAFTDDDGNDEERTSAATAAVVTAAEPCADRTHSDWCTKLTVGKRDRGSDTTYGFVAGGGNDYGTLDDKDIGHGTISESVNGIWIWDDDGGSDYVVVRLVGSRVPHDTEFNLGGEVFEATAATEHPTNDKAYRWDRPAFFTWLDGQEVTVSANLPPVLDSATVDGTELVLTYVETLDTTSTPDTDEYEVKVDGGPGTEPSGVTISGREVELTLATAVSADQTVTVSYTVPASGSVQDESGIDAPGFVDQEVDNNTEASGDATLSALVVSDGTSDLMLTPAFDPATREYAVMVPNAVAQVTVTPTENDANAMVAYTPAADADPDTDGHQVDVVEGENTITVKVTAEDDTTTLTYTVTVMREAATNTAPTAEDSSVPTDEDVPYTFKAEDFKFTDAEGDALAGVTIVTLPAAGALELDGTAVTAGLAIAAADIGKLVFTPAADGNGMGYASFTFKVSDGTDESADAYTMTVNVTPVNDPATGAPVVTGTAQVGQALTAAIGTIADLDVLPATFPDDYEFQWVRVTGTTETNIGTAGPDNTYTPVAADVGNTLKVKVTFTDDDGNDEERTSAATAAVEAAPDTAAPVFLSATVDGAELVLVFDEALAAASGLTTTAFTVKKTPSVGAEETVALGGTPAIAGSAVTLTLARAVVSTDEVTVSYAKPSSGTGNRLEDAAGNEVADFTDESVTNNTAATITAASDDATLSALVVSDGTSDLELDPAFDSDMYEYSATVANTVTQVTVTPTVNDSGATHSFPDTTDANSNTTDGHQVTVDVGTNLITVTVTAADGSTEPYTVTVTRVPAAPTSCVTGDIWCATLAVEEVRVHGSMIGNGYQSIVHAGALSEDGFTYDTTPYTVTAMVLRLNGNLEMSFTPTGETVFDGEQFALFVDGTPLSFGTATFHASSYFRWTGSGLSWDDGDEVVVRLVRNTAARGNPGITGVPQVGQTLEATAGDIGDDDDLPPTTFPDGYGFQWVRVDALDNETDVGTDSATYDPVAADVGNTLKVAVTFTDGAGFEETVESAATAAVVTAAEPCADRTHSDWCTKLTVGKRDRGSDTTYGFGAGGGNDYGTLDDKDIGHGTISESVNGIWIWDDDGGSDYVVVRLVGSRVPHDTEFNLGGEVFEATAATEHPTNDKAYRWDRPAFFTWLDGQEVTVSANLPPVVDSATVDGTELVLTYVETLDTTSTPDTDEYEVKVDGGPATEPSGVTISGREVELTLATAVSADQTVTVSYTVPASGPVQDESGIDAPGFIDQEVDNDTAASGDATLRDLVVNDGTSDLELDPTFASDEYSYTATVGNAVMQVTVTATRNDSNATVAYEDGAGSELTDADLSAAGHQVTVNVGDNVIVVTVTAEDGTPLSYTVTVTREAPPNTAPTASHATVPTDEDVPYTFKAGDFKFADDDAGDALASVTIVTLPAAGTLELNGSAVLEGATVAASAIGMLEYTPAADAHGTGYASFEFRVSDGTDESAAAYTMTVDVTAVNDPASGTPAITGTATVGETLTAAIGTIADDDGLPTFPSGYALQWYRVDADGTSNKTEITGATSDTYTLTGDELGKRVVVEVSFDDEDGNAEGPLASAAYPSTGTVTSSDTAAPEFSSATVNGTELVIVFNEALAAASALANDAFTVNKTPSGGSAETVGLSGSPSIDATSVTLTLAQAVVSSDEVTVSYAKPSSGTDNRLEDAAGNEVADFADAMVTNTTAMGQPTISGTPQVGQVLTAGAGTIADTNGLPTTTFPDGYGFQWVRVDGSDNETAISGAMSHTYTPVAADVGNTLKVKVRFTDGAGFEETVESAATAAVVTAAEPCADRTHSDWCTKLTVGKRDRGSDTTYGFVAGGGNDYGTLDDKDIGHGTISESVNGIWIWDDDGGSDYVVVRLVGSRVPHDTEFNLGGEVFEATAATEHPTNDKAYRWDRPAFFTWLDGQEVTVSANLPPVVDSATVDGTALVLTYVEALDTGSRPGTDAYAVKVDGGPETEPSGVSIAGKEVELTLAAAVSADQTVTVSYTVPASGPVQDESGIDAPALDDREVDNDTAASGDATLRDLVVNDGTSDLELDPTFASDEYSYTATVGNAVMQVTVTATRNDSNATVAYEDGAGSELTDADLSAAGHQVTVNVGDNVIVVTVTAEDGTPLSYTVTVTREAPPNTAPTASHATVPTDEDVPYTFKAADFKFADDDAGDELASVTIVTLPAAGELELNGSAVLEGATVAASAIGMLEYTPAANANGDDYASFMFRVSDGTDESADAYTMTVDVTAVNDPATGAPVVTGTAQVGQALTAAIGTIADLDVLPDTFPDDYEFQWVRVTGTTETNIGTAGPDNIYTPVAADVGNTLKVKVTFTDDDGNDEERTSAATAAVVTAAEPCADRTHSDWCTKLTVGKRDRGSDTTYGFGAGGGNDYGTLDDKDIGHGTISESVNGIWIWDDDGGSDYVVVRLVGSRVPHNTEFNLGGEVLEATTATEHPTNDKAYRWDRPAFFTWLDGQEVTVSANLPPVVDSATVDGTELVLTYVETLDTTSTPDTDEYEVKVDGGPATEPSGVTISGREVELTLATAVSADQTVTVSYTVPASGSVQDESGIDAPGFVDQEVDNITEASDAPEITIASGGGVTEGDAAVFTLSRTGVATDELVVNVTVSETGDAVAASAEGARSVTFAAGNETATLSVPTVDDAEEEDASTVTATVAVDGNDPETYMPGTPASAVVIVSDNDGGICARTQQVRDAIVALVAAAATCADVTDAHLAEIDGNLDLSPGDLGSLQAGDFAGLTAVTLLDLSFNDLASLPDGVFDELTALKNLRLNSNELESLPSGVFDELTALKTLSLSSNELASLTGGVFDELTALETLTMNSNRLSSLPDGVFDELTALEELRLDRNQLSLLPDGVFDELTALEELRLNRNQLSSLPDGVFDELTALTDLNVSDNPGSPFSPTADAGADVTVPADGGTITLDGSASAGGPWGSNLVYAWTQTDGPTAGVTIATAAGVTTTVTVPALSQDAVLEFTLTVTGRTGENNAITQSATDTVVVRLAENTTAMGNPGITGVPQVGQTLEATAGDIGDDDDLPTTTFPDGYGFQWVRVDASDNETDVGSDSHTYTPVAADVGNTLKVAVTFTDRAGFEETVESAATAAVVEAAEPCADRTHSDWCTLLTVGQLEIGGSPTAVFGYDGGSTTGSLDDAMFDDQGEERTVLTMVIDETTNEEVRVVLDAFVARGAVFNLGGREFPAGADSENAITDGNYSWDRPTDFAWLDGRKVTVSANLAPTLTGATVDGTELVLTYGEDLDTGSEPAAGSYAVKVDGGTGAEPSGVEVDTRTVTLTLATAVSAGQKVTVSYTVPATSPVQDESSIDAPGFMDQEVDNDTGLIVVGIESSYDSIGAGLEDLVFTLTRAGATTAALEATVTITQDQDWLGSSDLSHDVTFLAGEAEAELTLAASSFSFEPDTRGDLIAAVSGTGIADGSKTVEIVSTAAPPLTVRYDKLAYTFAEDAADDEVVVYLEVTLHPDYPRPPSREDVGFALKTESLTATFREDFVSVNWALTLGKDDFGALADGSHLARKRLQNNDGTLFDVVDDEIYEGSEDLVLKIELIAPFPAESTAFVFPDGAGGECTLKVDCAPDNLAEYPVTITDEEDVPVLELSAERASIREADDDATPNVAENESVVTVASGNGKTFVDDRTITLTFAGTAEKGTDYTVGPMDADDTAPGYQVVLLAETASVAAVTVTAVDNDAIDSGRTVEVSGSLDGAVFATATVTIADDERGNVAPEFTEAPDMERRVVETAPAGTDVGAPVAATDGDGDTLTYGLEGADAASFAIDAASGQLRTKAGVDYDFEAAKNRYSVTVTAADDYGGTASIDVTVRVTDADEPPGRPGAPGVTVDRDSVTSLVVSWAEPDNAGPEIEHYDLRYRAGATGGWTDGPQDVAATTATVENLTQDTEYEVQVRARNAEGDGAWSPSGRGTPRVQTERWGDVRLVDAQGGTESGSGRLEVFYRGRWGTVCDDRFDRDFTVYGPNYGPPVNDKTDKKVVANQAAEVACKKMSYATGAMVSGLGIGLAAEGTKIWLDDVRCAEEEADWRVNRGKDPEDDDWRSSRAGLHDCYHAGIKLNNCTREENVHLQCVGGEAGGSLPELTGEMEQDHEYHEYHYGPGYPFTVRIGFSEAVERDKVRAAMTIETATGSSAGSVQGLAVVDGDRRHWEATIAPTVREDMTVSVTVSTPCHEDAGVCTADGRRLDDFSGATRRYSAPLTAEFRPPKPRTEHDGSPFEVRLVFSVAIRDTFAVPVSPDALEVTDGTIEGIARAADGLSATVTIEPESATKDVGFHLKERHACSLAGAICKQVADMAEHPLLNPLRLTFHARPGTSTQEGASPLTARFADVPVEHDGKSAFNLRLAFSEAVFDGTEAFDKNKAVRDALAVSGGDVRNARRVDPGAFDAWWVRVKPSGNEAVSLSLGPAPDCAAAGALCTPDGRALSNGIAARVQGPAGLAVADARVDEGPGATLAFEVTLDRARHTATSVDYATEDGSAEAGTDYEATSGTLEFAAGERSKTIAVTVLDDAHDEGDETLILRLSNPSGAYLADAEATGTIENTDAMPRAWLARFGRTVAEQVLDAVQERMRAAPRAGAQVTLAGHRLGAGTPDAEALEAVEESARPEGLSAWLRGEACGGAAGAGAGCPAGTRGAPRTMTVLDLLSGSSFALTGGTPAGGYATLWGRGALSRFDGRVADAGGRGALTIAGEVVSVMLGADWARERVAAGVLMSHAWGEGSYRGADSGEVASTLTGLYPWGRYAISDRVTVWGAAGYGVGTLPLTLATGAVIETDIALALVAAGLRGVVIAAPAGGGPEVAVKTDALAVRTSSDAVGGGAGGAGGNLAAATADVTRLRLGLEGTWRGLELGTLEPRIETGVRYDDGDAETGFGLDLGGGLAWSDPATGVDAEVSGRGLLTHESAGFGQLGFAGRLGWNPRPDSDRGPNLTLTQTVGLSAHGGMNALLGRRTLEGLAAHDDGDDLARRRLEFALGYGFPLFGDRFTSTPELGFAMTAAHREYRLGWRLAPARGAGNVSFDLGIEATRRESVNGDAAPEHAAGMQLNLRW